jgi:hypothetical protein
MSDRNFLLRKKADLEGIRVALLENAAEARTKADRAAQDRDRPRDPTRAYEHAKECDRLRDAYRRDAERRTRDAESKLAEIRGLERQLSEYR